MAERKPDNVYLTVNKETGTKRLIRAVGVVAARNHAADQLFEVRRLSTGETLDVQQAEGLQIETAGESAQPADPAEDGEQKGGSDDEK